MGRTRWEVNAGIVQKYYGGYVDWEERFYLCPECDEPVYECDWDEYDLSTFLCPVCEFTDDDEGENDLEYDPTDLECGFDPYMGCYSDDC